MRGWALTRRRRRHAGRLFDAAGRTAASWVVFEIRESVDPPQRFTDDSRAPALQAIGFSEPPGWVEWIDLGARRAAPEA